MTTSDRERAVIEAAKALVTRLNKDGEWATDEYGQSMCIACGGNGIHDSDCELAILMNVVDRMEDNVISKLHNQIQDRLRIITKEVQEENFNTPMWGIDPETGKPNPPKDKPPTSLKSDIR